MDDKNTRVSTLETYGGYGHTDAEKGEQVLPSKRGTLMEGSVPLSQEGYHSTSVNSSVEDVPEVTRRSNRRKVQSGRPAEHR